MAESTSLADELRRLTPEQRLCISRLVATLEKTGNSSIDNELLIGGQAFNAFCQQQHIGIDASFVGSNESHEGADVRTGVARQSNERGH